MEASSPAVTCRSTRQMVARVAQTGNSILQMVCPKAAEVPTMTALNPTDDATVAAGANSASNFGTDDTLKAGLHHRPPTTHLPHGSQGRAWPGRWTVTQQM